MKGRIVKDETELNEVMTYQGKNGFMIIAIL